MDGLVGTIEARLQLGENLRDRAAFVAHGAVGRTRAVEVPIDDARHDHAPPQVGHLSLWAGKPLGLLVRADVDDTAIADGECLLEFRRVRAFVAFRTAEYEDAAVAEIESAGAAVRASSAEAICTASSAIARVERIIGCPPDSST